MLIEIDLDSFGSLSLDFDSRYECRFELQNLRDKVNQINHPPRVKVVTVPSSADIGSHHASSVVLVVHARRSC